MGLDSVEDYYHDKFQVIPIMGLPCYRANNTHPQTHTHKHHDKVIAVSATGRR